MHAMKLSFRLIAAVTLTATTAVAFAAEKEAAKKAPSEKQMIASAMSDRQRGQRDGPLQPRPATREQGERGTDRRR